MSCCTHRWARIAGGAIVVALSATSCHDATGPVSPGIHVGRESILSDTIESTHRLTVVVGHESGGAAAGRIVRFEVVPPGTSATDVRLNVAPVDSVVFRWFAVDTTDSRGRAQIGVRFLYTAGPANLVVKVPELGLVDTVTYDIRPGKLHAVKAEPADTAVHAGAGYTLRAAATDRAGNALPDALAYSAPSGPVTISSAGAISVSAIGRGMIVARLAAGVVADTSYVSVIPEAWVASEPFYTGNGGPIGIDLMRLDGSSRQRIGPGIENVFITHGFSWSPDGSHLAVAVGYFVSRLTPGAGMTPVIEMNDEVLTSATYSRDGQWIYFAKQYASSGTQPSGIYRVHPDGTGLERLGASTAAVYPWPSHDGATVVYVDYNCSPEYCIRLRDVVTQVDRTWGGLGNALRGRIAAWSPVKDLIAYDTGTELRLIRSDGTGNVTLAPDVFGVKWMDWSPDGRWLLVSAQGVILFEVATGLRLPIAQLAAFGPTTWRP